MAYGRIYIENLKNKVTAIFDELQAENRLGEHNFIDAFKRKYPKDYAMLQYEWEFKIHEFKKNRKGNPKPHPIRPERILSNMYRNYYYKLVKKPSIEASQKKYIDFIRAKIGKSGFSIKKNKEINRYNIIRKKDKVKLIVCENLTYGEISKMFSIGISQAIHQLNEMCKAREEEKQDG